ncbi:MAG TPA: zf-HC2 domain-containing protein [Burkholderiales bacterium]|nr:zf-HC2 domain-containing protein [Burkholderiales bacterium]
MMMPSCKEVTRLVSEGLDRELRFGERVALRVHFVMCRGCRNFEDEMARLRKAMQDLARTDDERPA